MSLPERYVARVIDNSLVAAEGVLFGKKSGGASGHEGGGLVITEAREDGIGAGEVVVEADVEFGLVEAANRLAQEVISILVVTRSGRGIQIDQA